MTYVGIFINANPNWRKRLVIYAKFDDYNISYDEFRQEFCITSKTGSGTEIGWFQYASDAIEFADKRVTK